MSEPWPRFTPTMARLKSDYIEMREEHFGFSDLYAEEWDRAQAEHDRQVAAKAWDQGKGSVTCEFIPSPGQMATGKIRMHSPRNPYANSTEVRAATEKIKAEIRELLDRLAGFGSFGGLTHSWTGAPQHPESRREAPADREQIADEIAAEREDTSDGFGFEAYINGLIRAEQIVREGR